MNDVIAKAKVTFTEAVGAIKIGTWPIRFETRMRTAKVATTGKYLEACGPITFDARSLRYKKPASAVICALEGSSSDSLSLRILITTTESMHAITNMIVYHGIAFSIV